MNLRFHSCPLLVHPFVGNTRHVMALSGRVCNLIRNAASALVTNRDQFRLHKS